jgi:hypothetical protein
VECPRSVTDAGLRAFFNVSTARIRTKKDDQEANAELPAHDQGNPKKGHRCGNKVPRDMHFQSFSSAGPPPGWNNAAPREPPISFVVSRGRSLWNSASHRGTALKKTMLIVGRKQRTRGGLSSFFEAEKHHKLLPPTQWRYQTPLMATIMSLSSNILSNSNPLHAGFHAL